MAIELSKIEDIARQFKGYDDDGKTYTFRLEYTTPNDGAKVFLHATKLTGVDTFRNRVNKLIQEYGADSITVTGYNGKTMIHQMKNSPTFIQVRDTGEGKTKVIHAQISEVSEVSDLPKSQSQIQPALNGLGDLSGLDGYVGMAGVIKVLEAQNQVRDKEYDIRKASDKNEELAEKLGDLEREFDELETENERLWEENNRIKAENLKLELYRPEGNFKLFGFDGTKLLGTIVGESVKHIAKSNPEGALKVAARLGLTSDDLAGFLDEPTEALTDNFPEGQDEELSEAEQRHLEVCNQIRDWLRSVPSKELTELYRVLYVLTHNVNLIQPTIEFLKGKNPKEEEQS